MQQMQTHMGTGTRIPMHMPVFISENPGLCGTVCDKNGEKNQTDSNMHVAEPGEGTRALPALPAAHSSVSTRDVWSLSQAAGTADKNAKVSGLFCFFFHFI